MTDNELRIRACEPEDLEVMYELENDPSLWDVSCTTVPYSRYILRQYLEQATGDMFTDKQVRFMVERMTDGKVLGCVDLTNYEPLHDRAEIGMAVLSDHQGQGIGRRALRLLCQYAYTHLHLHQIVAYIPADNEACLQMFHSEGFTSHLRLKDWLRCADGTYKDAVLVQCLLDRENPW